MKQYKVNYVAYNTIGYGSVKGSKVISATSKEHAKQQVEELSQMGLYDFFVECVEELGDLG